MTTNTQLLEKYHDFSTHQLLLILEEAEDYRPEAIEAVNTVLAGRQITPEQQAYAQEKAEEIRTERERPVEWITSIRQLLGAVFQRLIDFTNPIQEEPISLKRQIIMIACLYSLFALQFIWSWGPNFQFLQEYPPALIEIGFMIDMIPSVLVPIAVILFWIRKKAGWLLLNSYTVYFGIAKLFELGVLATVETSLPPGSLYSLDPIPMPRLLPLLVYAILAAVFTWLINKETFRHAFGVTKNAGRISSAIGVILAMLMIGYVAS